MCIVTILVHDISETQEVELLLAATSCNIYGEKDRPSDTAAHQAGCGSDLEISEEQEGIERLVVQNEAIRDLGESAKPIQQAIG